jgi:hypothetical protein
MANGTNGTATKPKVELALNESATLKLMKDKPYSGENSFGPYYLYSVSHEGAEKAFFTSSELHQRIVEAGLKTGDEFRITKVAIQSGKKVTAKVEFAVVSKAVAPAPQAGVVPGEIQDDGFKELMRRCVQDAVDIVKEVNTIPWQNEDVRSLAVTLFIQRVRS